MYYSYYLLLSFGFKAIPQAPFLLHFLRLGKKANKIKFSGLQTVFLQGGGRESQCRYWFAEYEGIGGEFLS